MNRTTRHLVLGASTGVTVFAIVVPLIHVLAELATLAGVELGTWDNPVEVFIFVMTAAMVGVFPWGLWIVVTDARKGNLFDVDHEVFEYFVAALSVFIALTLLVCTRVQPVYAQFRWFLTPALFVFSMALIWWRWCKVWRMAARNGIRGIIGNALAM